jgi:hypothetical protein
MDKNNKTMGGLKLVSDWAKWLITIESGAIAVIGGLIKLGQPSPTYWEAVFATLAIVCFLVSIATAALLLLSLPEIAQKFDPDENIWLASDSVIGPVLHMGIQGFATFESLFFGVGLVSFHFWSSWLSGPDQPVTPPRIWRAATTDPPAAAARA